MLRVLHKKYEFNFPSGQEGFELLYEFIIQPNTNFNVWFPQYSNKLWHGEISKDRTKFDIKMRRQNSRDCVIIFDTEKKLVSVESTISILYFLPAMVFLVVLLCLIIFGKNFEWGLLVPFFFISAASFLPFLARRDKMKSIEYNIRMVEHYLTHNRKQKVD